MAKTAYSSELIGLQDGKEVKLIPLPIGRLRRFMDAWSEFGDVTEDDNSYPAFRIYINVCGVALEKVYAEEVEKQFEIDEDTDKEVLTPEYRKVLEDVLDMATIFKIIEVCGGINMNDPKLAEEAEKA